MSLATAGTYRTNLKIIASTINSQILRSSNVYGKVTSRLQYTQPWRLAKIRQKKKKRKEAINFGEFINQFPPFTISLIRWLETINSKLFRQMITILFNQICVNMLTKYTLTHPYIYIYICVCVYMCVCVLNCPVVIVIFTKQMSSLTKNVKSTFWFTEVITGD